ncbi:hypothetical protein [Streptomyces bullii]|uniref:Uncharacterized protein n=1 Tax=Streptomyces bullii TaxID=349910 RepID=A0ABW0V1U8_9ACTN
MPAVFHALWHGQLTTPLVAPPHERVLVTARDSSGPGKVGSAG